MPAPQNCCLKLAQLVILSCILTHVAFGQTQQFNKRIDFGSYEFAFNIEVTDEGYLVFGSYLNPLSNGRENLLIGLDSEGSISWHKSYATPGLGRTIGAIAAINRLSDGNFLIAAYQGIFSEYNNPTIFKVTPSGDSLWFHQFNFDTWDEFSAAQQTSDTSFLCIGSIRTQDPDADVLLAEVTASGGVLWQKALDFGFGELGYSITPAPDSGFYLGMVQGGDTNDPSGNSLVARIDDTGNVLWHTVFGGPHNEFYPTVHTLANGDLLVATEWIDSVGPPTFYLEYGRGFLARIQPDGQIAWTNTYGPSLQFSRITDVEEQANGNLLCLGTSEYLQAPGERINWILEVSPNGDSLREKRFEYTITDNFFRQHQLVDLDLTDDGGFVCAGSLWPTTSADGTQDIWVAKFDSLWCSQPDCNPPASVADVSGMLPFSVFPNPADDQLTISWKPLNSVQPLTFTIRDLLGRELLREQRPPHSQQAELSVRDLPVGTYLLTISDAEQQLSTQKLVIWR